MGLMDIYNGKIAPEIAAQAAAKIFAQIDDKLAFDIYCGLDPAIKRTEPHAGRNGGPCKTCGREGEAVCEDPSEQQALFGQLMSTRKNTLLARGEAALKGLGQ